MPDTGNAMFRDPGGGINLLVQGKENPSAVPAEDVRGK